MPKSSLFSGRRGRTTDVNVIDPRFRNSSLRRAKIAFLVVLLVGTFTIAVVAAQVVNPVVAVFVGFLASLALAFAVGVLVFVWPLLRILWHWAFEIVSGTLLLSGVEAMGQVVHGLLAVVIVAASVGGLLVYPPLRRRLLAFYWCGISRHRLRVCFRQFLPADRSGNLPLILWAKPTPVGEDIWVWLRPGLSREDVTGRADKMAVACWANTVEVEAASRRFAAYVRVHIKRRTSFDHQPDSPLWTRVRTMLGRVPSSTDQPVLIDGDVEALELHQVPATTVAASDEATTKPTKRPDKPGHVYKPTGTPSVEDEGSPDGADDFDGAAWA